MPLTSLVLLNRPSGGAAAHNDAAPAFSLVDSLQPQLSALDLGATRGDGIFETISVGAGYPQALDHHLRRFAQSAQKLELPTPDASVWRLAIRAAIDALDDSAEASVKIVLTRGVEGDSRPTGWVFAAHSPDYARVRVDGVRVVTLDRGYRHDVERTSPWLLAGAKTLSYAVNRSVMREAARRNADDVIFISSDGFVLEGPSSSVIFRRGNQLLTPGTGLGILDGTTQSSIFEYATTLGLETGFELISAQDLSHVDAVWLVSSVRLAAPVRELDGVPFAVDSVLSAGINDYLRALTI